MDRNHCFHRYKPGPGFMSQGYTYWCCLCGFKTQEIQSPTATFEHGEFTTFPTRIGNYIYSEEEKGWKSVNEHHH